MTSNEARVVVGKRKQLKKRKFLDAIHERIIIKRLSLPPSDSDSEDSFVYEYAKEVLSPQPQPPPPSDEYASTLVNDIYVYPELSRTYISFSDSLFNEYTDSDQVSDHPYDEIPDDDEEDDDNDAILRSDCFRGDITSQ